MRTTGKMNLIDKAEVALICIKETGTTKIRMEALEKGSRNDFLSSNVDFHIAASSNQLAVFETGFPTCKWQLVVTSQRREKIISST